MSDLQTTYKQTTSWRADFSQSTHVEMIDKKVKKTGFIAVKRPDNIHIEYTEPYKVYVSNGKKLWVYKDDKTAWEFKKPHKVITKEALSFLSGLGDLTVLFDVVENLNESSQAFKIRNKKLKKLSLIPKDQNSDLLRITVGVDLKTYKVKEAILYSRSGNTSYFEFKNVTFNLPLDEQLFSLPGKKQRKIIRNQKFF